MRRSKYSINVIPLILMILFLSTGIASSQSNAWLTVTSPNDITIVRGQSNRGIIWSVDSHLNLHWRILQNGSEILICHGHCTSANISVRLNELDIGTYIFELEVWTDYDPQSEAGESIVWVANDVVIVDVIPSRNFWLDVGFFGSLIGILIIFKIAHSYYSKR